MTIPPLDAFTIALLDTFLIILLGAVCRNVQKDFMQRQLTRPAPRNVLQGLMQIMKRGTAEVYAIMNCFCIVTILPGSV